VISSYCNIVVTLIQYTECVLQAMVNVQMLSELEEVIQYKLVPERQESIRTMWWNRLQVSIYYSMLCWTNVVCIALGDWILVLNKFNLYLASLFMCIVLWSPFLSLCHAPLLLLYLKNWICANLDFWLSCGSDDFQIL
jgi:hypothetical protein